MHEKDSIKYFRYTRIKYFKNLEQVQDILDLWQFAVQYPWRVWGLYSQLHKGQQEALDSS